MSHKPWINLPIREGKHSRQAHCDLPDNTYERELGREGFYGPVSHMHHQHPPTGWVSFEGPLSPHAFDLNQLPSTVDSPWGAPVILKNAETNIRLWTIAKSMSHLVRNSDGDELLFLHEGQGDFYCDYGHFPIVEGDYIVIPRGTAWRIDTASSLKLLMIENRNGSYRFPDKGFAGYNAFYDPATLDHPRINSTFKQQQDENTWEIHIKRLDAITKLTYPFNPLDAVGWHGTNTVVRLNWRDIRPLISHRYHLPPSVHTTFVGQGFVVCTFCPRPIESDPNALKVPFFHNNDDYDEVIFYHKGNFFSRDHIDVGMVTFHPCGFPHGPHPKALKKSQENPATFTDEVAVMIDTRHPLTVTEAAHTVEVKEYVHSWKSPEGATS
ncbi:homogentisate 1,2-dioxygenase [Candidatus Sororendozoicomonas aggregata]|uniref:homogentisate 1,2-dioxygenase n=1 Tax=Candidatus Sororendozoicomonas aggregata TaxID=3073239 RepID=UPI002ED042B1